MFSSHVCSQLAFLLTFIMSDSNAGKDATQLNEVFYQLYKSYWIEKYAI